MKVDPEKLVVCRKKIDEIDSEIIILLKKRILVLDRIKKIKNNYGLDARDRNRESLLISRASASLKNKHTTALRIYKKILSESLKFMLQK